MHRFLLAGILVAIMTSELVTGPAAATPVVQVSSKKKQPEINPHALRELLVKGLKVTRSEEQQYIDQVVTRVTEGKLSVSVVYASFRYARTRWPRYPYPYFVYSLETLSKREQQKQQ